MKKGSILFQLIVLCGVIGLLFFYTPEGGWYAKVLERYDLSTIVITKVCVGILILNFFGFFKMIYDYIIIKNGKKYSGEVVNYKVGFFLFRFGYCPVVEFSELNNVVRFKYNAYGMFTHREQYLGPVTVYRGKIFIQYLNFQNLLQSHCIV